MLTHSPSSLRFFREAFSRFANPQCFATASLCLGCVQEQAPMFHQRLKYVLMPQQTRKLSSRIPNYSIKYNIINITNMMRLFYYALFKNGSNYKIYFSLFNISLNMLNLCITVRYNILICEQPNKQSNYRGQS